MAGQLPTVQAVGGEGRHVDWPEAARTQDTLGADYFYHDCSIQLLAVNASSTHAPEGKFAYTVANLNDFNPMTAWVAGRKGIGEWFEIKSGNINVLYNGYQCTPQLWLDNSRVKTFKVYKNGKPLCSLQLTDEMGAQRFELPQGDRNLDKDTANIFRFEIVDIYRGKKWADVCISELENIGCCFSGATFISSGNDPLSIVQIKKESEITGINLTSKETCLTRVKQIASEKHLALYRLSTSTKTIELTMDHPLNFKNYGFSSVRKLLSNPAVSMDSLEVMTWNDKLQTVQYEKVTGVTKLEGVFDTYTILKIDKGDAYIANGFITKTY
jgi:hypothetical protein